LAVINKGNDYAVYASLFIIAGVGVLFFSKMTKVKDESRLPFEKRIEIIKKHELFYNLKKWIDFDIRRIDIENKKRQWNIQTHMKIKFSIFLEALQKELEKIKERRTVGDYEYWHVFLHRGIEEYIKKAVQAGVNEKYCEMFEEYHQKSELNTAESIREILQNPLYDDIEKFSAILDRFLWAFRETHNDIHKIIKINGRLEKALENWEIPRGC